MDLRVEERCRHITSKVRFNLGIACNQPASRAAPYWLAFESGQTDAVEDAATGEEKCANLQFALTKLGATKPKVRFDFSTLTISSPATRPRSAQEPQLDLCTISRLCKYVRQVMNQSLSQPLGFLKKSETFKHIVYPGLNRPNLSPGSKSLKDLLHTSSENSVEQGWVEKLQLARLLTLSVLRFHSTPWLGQLWSSRDIIFFCDQVRTRNESILKNPYLNAPLSSQTSYREIPGSTDFTKQANKELFSLAKVLIELAYDAPFEEISQPESPSDGNHQVKEFLAVRKLSKTVHKKLNATYGRLVEKCANCNFGVATDLKDAELQIAVLIHVVNQLDVCLKQWETFNSIAPIPI